MEIPRDMLPGGGEKVDQIIKKNLTPQINNLKTHIGKEKIAWFRARLYLITHGAQRRDLRDARRFVRIFPQFKLVGTDGNENPPLGSRIWLVNRRTRIIGKRSPQ